MRDAGSHLLGQRYRCTRFPLLLIVILALVSSDVRTALALPVPISAALQADANAFIGSAIDTASDLLTTSTPLDQPLSISLEALAIEGTNSSRAYHTVTASILPWSGSIVLEMGIEIDNPSGIGAGAQIAGSYDAWSYTFVPDTDGSFNFDYNVTGPMHIFFTNNGQWITSLVGSGSITQGLRSGEVHTVALLLHVGPSCFGGCDRVSSAARGDFQWAIVPEPSPLSLIALGLLAMTMRGGHGRDA